MLYWYTEHDDQKDLKGAIIFLPGRTNHGYSLLRTYTQTFDFSEIGLFSVTPPLNQGWYPPPKSPEDQQDAVQGLNNAFHQVEKIIKLISECHNLLRSKIIISGFSMGAVTAVHWGVHTKRPVAAVICHSGAILEPWETPKASHDMPIILNHSSDDYCFNWEERYIPMKRTLEKNNYNLWYAEREFGNHLVYHADVAAIKDIFEDTFNKTVDYQPLWAEAKK